MKRVIRLNSHIIFVVSVFCICTLLIVKNTERNVYIVQCFYRIEYFRWWIKTPSMQTRFASIHSDIKVFFASFVGNRNIRSWIDIYNIFRVNEKKKKYRKWFISILNRSPPPSRRTVGQAINTSRTDDDGPYVIRLYTNTAWHFIVAPSALIVCLK